MPPRICVNPHLNEFLYHVIYSASMDDKRAIPKRYARQIRNNTLAKRFVNASFFEEKLEILSALDVGWFLVLFDKKRNKGRSVSDLFKKCETSEPKSFINIAMEQGMYILTDRHMAMYQGLMADQTNHAIFSQNLLLSKAGYHAEKWKKRIDVGETKTAKENLDVAPYLVETILNTAIALEFVQSTAEVTANDFKILCYLYTKYHRYVKYEELMTRFSGNLSMSKITGCMRRLATGFLVQKPANPNLKEYQITAMGIKTVTNFWRQILKANEIQ